MSRFVCRHAYFALAVFAAAYAASVPGQNLLSNGDFATDVGGWDYPDGTPFWSAMDADSAPDSGSAGFTNVAVDAGVRQYVLHQCLPITEPGTYLFSVSAYTPTSQASGNLVMSYIVHPTAACVGGAINAGGDYMPSVGNWKNFRMAFTLGSPLPPNTSVDIELAVEKTPAGDSLTGYFDNVRLDLDTIFADNFEP